MHRMLNSTKTGHNKKYFYHQHQSLERNNFTWAKVKMSRNEDIHIKNECLISLFVDLLLLDDVNIRKQLKI